MPQSLYATQILCRLPELGPATYWKLIDAFGTAREALHAPTAALHRFLKTPTLTALKNWQLDPENHPVTLLVEQDLHWLKSHPQAKIISHQHNDYPPLLREIDRPPALLYLLGDSQALSFPNLAIVGSRQPTQGGFDNARQFASFLAQHGFSICSGLALGIDTAAHQGALASHGKTVAVLGCGLANVYPASNRLLAENIIAGGGVIVSEFPPETRPHASHFPRRNRIISGLSLATLVVEAAIKSGSLITARLAMEQNREVFAIPGSIHNPLARGCHRLIKEGAHLVETAADIVSQLGGLLNDQQFLPQQALDPRLVLLGEKAEILLEVIGFDPVDSELIAQRTGWSIGDIAAELIQLELTGLIESTTQGYTRTR